ncbi:MAG TPA: hypothetical protein DIW47_08935 [Bacteroidetes bacterium]|nr:hypothetical protein [Bacteroidota bacterium]
MRKKHVSVLLTLLFNLIALGLLLSPVWEYGFPLLYSDSGTYMAAAYDGIIPIDRPMAYPWFLRLSQFLFSMRFAPIAQGLLILYVAYVFVHIWLFPELKKWVSGLVIGLLALLTGLPHLVSQLMPDVFTGLLFFVVFLWTRKCELPLIHQIITAILILFLVASHTTHLLIFLLFYPAVVLAYGIFLKQGKPLYGAWIIAPALLIVPMINQWTDGRFFYSDSSRIFFAASLQTAGVMEPWLDKHCGDPEAPVFLCRNKEELRGKEGNYILWDSHILTDSACEQLGGWGYCWKLRNDELKPFMAAWWKDPESRQLWFQHALRATRAQILDFEIGFIKSQKEGSAPYSVLESRYPRMLEKYKASAQYFRDLHFDGKTKAQNRTVIISSILLIVLVLYGWMSSQWKKEWTLIILGLALFLVFNAFFCGVFSNALNRYQARVIWLIPFMTLCFSALFLSRLSKTKK